MSGEWRLRWHVFQCRRLSDTRSRFLLELARCVTRIPRSPHPAPLLEVGSRSGGSALLILRVLDDLFRGAEPPLVLTVDPYGTRPYEGRPFVYDQRHYRAMKRALAPYANHIHYMMDSTLFMRELEAGLYLWLDGTRQPVDRFTLVYLDGSHDPDIVWSEVLGLWPRVVPGGFLIIDDTDWFDGAVKKRLEEAAPKLGGRLRHNGKQSILER